MSLTVNRDTADQLSEELSRMQAQALFAGNSAAQKQHFHQIRANSVKGTQKERGRQAANWVQRQYNEVDKAFLEGFYTSKRTANALTSNDTRLDFDEFEDRDEDNMMEVRYNLTMVDDFINAGFTTDSSLARTVYTQQRESKWEASGERSMDGRARSNDDEAVLEIFGTPLPISHVDYDISQRQQQQSQNFGEDVETRKARQAGRILRETEEDQMLDGWSPTVEDARGNTVQMYGFRDSSVNISGTVAGSWGTASNVQDTIDNFLNALESQTTDNNRGPDPEQQGAWMYYHPNQRSDLRQADPRGDGNMSLRQRIEQDYPYVDLRAAGALSDGEVIMVAQDQRFAEVINAQAPTNLSEDVDFGLATQYKALSCRVPFFKSTYDGVKGIVRGTGAD